MLSCVRFFVTPWTAAGQASLSFTMSWCLLKLMSVESMMPSNHLILCRPLLLLPSVLSQLFSSGGQSIRASALASVLLMNIQDWFPLELTGLISLQSKRFSRVFSNHASSKAWILWCSAVFMVQFSHPHMTTGKTIALTRQTFVSKVMCLLFNSAILLNYYYSIQTFTYYISIYRIFCLSVFSKMLLLFFRD